ncbi:MAG: lytic murein transglycosylase [Actinomycetes bacterium]
MSRIPHLAIVVGTLAGVIVLTVASAGVYLLAHGGTGTPPATRVAGTAAPPPPRPDLPLVTVPEPAAEATPRPTPATSTPAAGGGPRLTPPAVVAIAPRRVGEAHLRKLRSLRHVRGTLAVGGGAVRVAGVTLNLLAVPVAEFPAWTPLGVADRPEPWEALRRGELVAEAAAARRLGLVPGAHYEIEGGPRLRLAAAAAIGLPGIDGYVSEETGRRLGLTPGVVVLVSGPVTRAEELTGGVRRVLGAGTQVAPAGMAAAARTAAPRAARTPSRDDFTGRVGRPASYIELYRRAAALCPGLSWTVLAAIGQVESGHGRNNGPSSAGALGPMQFMPATWRAYGVDGDGDGRADIMNPYDAVPAAAHYLCATGAGEGGDRLAKAIWHYNHSWSYVSTVLSLANAYAAAYPD